MFLASGIDGRPSRRDRAPRLAALLAFALGCASATAPRVRRDGGRGEAGALDVPPVDDVAPPGDDGPPGLDASDATDAPGDAEDVAVDAANDAAIDATLPPEVGVDASTDVPRDQGIDRPASEADAACAETDLGPVPRFRDAALPLTNLVQLCLDKSATVSAANPAPGEGPGVLDALRDARLGPRVFYPTARAGDGRRIVTLTMLAEGGGYRNRVGWYNVGQSPLTPAQRREVFACRDEATSTGCPCPCAAGARRAVPPDTPCVHWVNALTAELDFECYRAAGLWRGVGVGLFVQTPQVVNAGAVGSDCATAGATNQFVYPTDHAIPGTLEVRYLVYRSRTFTAAYYLAWEDLSPCSDNDFDDVLVRLEGVAPGCEATCVDGAPCVPCLSGVVRCGDAGASCVTGAVAPRGTLCLGGSCSASGVCLPCDGGTCC